MPKHAKSFYVWLLAISSSLRKAKLSQTSWKKSGNKFASRAVREGCQTSANAKKRKGLRHVYPNFL
jgi:hypothetical protein